MSYTYVLTTDVVFTVSDINGVIFRGKYLPDSVLFMTLPAAN